MYRFYHKTQEVQILSGRDKENKPSTRNWFYFSISGEYEDMNVKLVFEKINILFPVVIVFINISRLKYWICIDLSLNMRTRTGDVLINLSNYK
jgi:hypothetical protein